ncbi:MAG TPA: glycosyltransferase [Deltaproteobacteria bacterium]|nr:glycosyltransferase [Deltaproteobacteria bacterium]
MRWVLLTDDHPPRAGGVAAFVDRVGAGLVRRGHTVAVFARRVPGLRIAPGTALTPVSGPSFGRYAGRWLGLRATRAILEADRVLATTWICGTFAARLPTPLHVIAHGSDVTRPPLRPAAFGRVWAAAHGRHALSAFLAGVLRGRGIEAGILAAPVDAAPQPIRAERRGCYGLIARATPLKGGDRFVRLVAAAGVRGVVVGDGPELGAWRALADRLGAPITFTGALAPAQVAAVLRTLDLVCLLPRAAPDGSGAEGLGLVLIEAAAQGVPAVGCATGGVPEAVGPGLILDDPDDPGACAEAVRSWWRPDRGAEAWAWCRASHGVDRGIDTLLEVGRRQVYDPAG